MSAKRLNKDECNSIANKMTESISNEINTIDNWFDNLNRQLLEEKVPEPIMSLFSGDDKLAKYINTVNNGCLRLNNRYIYTEFDKVPSNSHDYRPTLTVPEENKRQFNNFYEKREALNHKKSSLVKELQEVLYKLGTPKRITEHLPEALPFLPEVEESNLPQINLTQFRQKLKEELGEIK